MSEVAARVASFEADGVLRYGVITQVGAIDLTPEFGGQFPDLRRVIEAGALEQVVREAEGREVNFAPKEIRYRIPILDPKKIICVGANFRNPNADRQSRAEQPPRPTMFVRFPSSFAGHEENLIRPSESDQLDYEGEVAIVVGKRGRRVPEESAYDYVAALTLCNEGTIRDWERHNSLNFTQGKNWQSSGAMGPWLVPFRSSAQLDDIELVTRVNGQVRQRDHSSNMIFSFRYIINYISTFCTLEPGDMIVCGTPLGTGARSEPPVWLKAGDVVEVEAAGIGILRNRVKDEDSPLA